jgi:hypothetical protein
MIGYALLPWKVIYQQFGRLISIRQENTFAHAQKIKIGVFGKLILNNLILLI